ncbi:hypothetical protein M501DRAFT_1002311 [Patellaria atrata CBS 101060]|uniref:MARVEL domain-containing protein n=1 Tax=Patellaria atrata CBS 101060 TaxID=1346257 RepID=A0A9P4SEA4_9PEZI|nr:hypothetical protein M501DRAFT_1002311 [Patellaria atrata CBS 101060]
MAYAAGNSPWLKRVLIPFWTIRLIFMVIIVASYIAATAIFAKDGESAGVIAVVVVFLLIFVFVLLLDVYAIILFARHSLSPKKFLIMNVIQSTIWLAVIIIEVVGAARTRNAAGLVSTFVIALTFLALLIYGGVIYSRARKDAKRGNYAPTPNPNAGGLAPQQFGVQPGYQDTTYRPPSSQGQQAIPPVQGAAAGYYNPQQAPQLGYYAPQAMFSQQPPSHQQHPNPFRDPNAVELQAK